MSRDLYTNRLIHQKSPYLLQHAHNPVDWYPWGQEAFNAAKELDKPIFLSIGYATCHWCHVMEKESFEDPRIAQILNNTFINIKVDREELPEVDSLYMEFAQGMMSETAGWPLNVILTPELQPFFAATYLPPHGRQGVVGLIELTKRIEEVWHGEEREAVLMQAAQVVEVFAENIHPKGDEMLEKEQLQDTAELLFKMADPTYGGMRGTPKFPVSYQYNFLLHYFSKLKDSRALFLVERTLNMMHRGGIFDHLGGGFSRYSVDSRWLVPHFEKMLYDNALLAHTYLETWQVTKRPVYREVCESILQYVLRKMTHPEGGFYSAEDADSEGQEGLFYTWTPQEIYAALGHREAELICGFYGVTEEGNFEGRNILHVNMPIEEFAAAKGEEIMQLARTLADQRHRLWQVREKRVHPLKDDKILSSWNGLMIFSMVEAGCAFNDLRYINAALHAAHFIRSKLWVDGRLLRRWREGEASFNAGLDEYAFLIRALISLFEADCGQEWLEWGIEMCELLENHYKEKEGAFYQTSGTDENLILRKCQFADGAEPSGNALHCENLLRLYQITSDVKYLNQAQDILKAVKRYVDTYPPGYCFHMMNLNRYYDTQAPRIVIALNEKEDWLEELRQLLFSEFIPHKALIWRHSGDEKLIFHLLPFIKEQPPLDGKTTLYICYEGVCREPINDFSAMEAAIHQLR